MINDSDEREGGGLLPLELMSRLEGIVQPDGVVSHISVDLAQMQAFGLPHTRPSGALVMANEPGTELHVTYAMEIDESPGDVATRLPVFRSDGWPTDEGWTQTPREWKACST